MLRKIDDKNRFKSYITLPEFIKALIKSNEFHSTLIIKIHHQFNFSHTLKNEYILDDIIALCLKLHLVFYIRYCIGKLVINTD